MDQSPTLQPFTRDRAFAIVKKYLTNQNLIKHSLAAEAAMRGIYRYLHTNLYDPQMEARWGITGLLHDADYELAKNHPEIHGVLLFDKEPDVPEDIAYAIKGHNWQYTKVMPQSSMDWAIACCDQLTGLVVACALVHPDKKLASITPEFVLKRMNEKSFAKGADREAIKLCTEKMNIPLVDFVKVTFEAMQAIAPDIGL